MGLDTGASTTHIVPVILGDEQRTLKARDKLQQRGINVSAVRPPTVPPHTAFACAWLWPATTPRNRLMRW